MRWLRVLSVLLLLIAPSAVTAQSDITLYTTEQAAQQHCPADVVVWVNTQSGVYHLRGQRYYANTKAGAFVCRKEADQHGYRVTKNGQ